MNTLTDSGRIRQSNEADRLTIRPKDEIRFRPVLDRILVEEIPVEESRIVTGGGLTLEQSQHFVKKSNRARVLAVGDGVPMGNVIMPMPYKVGQVIQCGEYGRKEWFAKPEDRYNKDLPKRYTIRVADTDGEVLE